MNDKFTAKWWLIYLLFWNLMKGSHIIGNLSPLVYSAIEIAVMLPLLVLSVHWLKKDKSSIFGWLVTLLCLAMMYVDAKQFFMTLTV